MAPAPAPPADCPSRRVGRSAASLRPGRVPPEATAPPPPPAELRPCRWKKSRCLLWLDSVTPGRDAAWKARHGRWAPSPQKRSREGRMTPLAPRKTDIKSGHIRVMRFAVLFAAWAFLGLTAPAMAAGKAPPPPPPPPDLGRAVVFPGGVMVSPDLIYGQIDGFRPLTLDLYQIPPKPKETGRPAILFVHGGLWTKGDARHVAGFDDSPGLLASLAAKDYVVASVNYRLAGEAHFPAAVPDAKSAVRWLRTHSSEYDIDTTRVMVWGAEAGGQIASLVGTSCGDR